MERVVVTLTVRDGEFEYNNTSAICGENSPRELAEDWGKNFLGGEMTECSEGWEEVNGYRIIMVEKVESVSREEFLVLRKYI